MNYPHFWLFIAALLLATSSLVLFYLKKDKAAVFGLFLSALFVRLFIVHLDPFLHDWDERFHALVAKNLMDDPFKPMLNPSSIIPLNYTFWTENHIWLHKQPLFLWQMALSMKIFGVSEFTLRYPSALMGALMVVFIYRIVWNMSRDRMLAFGSALFMCFSNYQIELISGFIGMDHNDVAFGFYVLASIWAYAESLNDKRIVWVLMVGLFAGCAVLNKWLTGLLVFGGWGINIIYFIKKDDFKTEVVRLGTALLSAILVFAPWQLYILHAFPLEAHHEYAYNTKHVVEAVENHGGGVLFYYYKLRQYFGLFTWQLLPLGLLVFALSKAENLKVKIHLLASFIIVFLFFSLVVKTKMQSYVFVVGPIGYVFMVYALVKLTQLAKFPVVLIQVCLAVCAWFLLNLNGIMGFFHNPNDVERIQKINATRTYKSLNSRLKPGTKFVVNAKNFSDVEMMFFNGNTVVYNGKMEEKNIELLLQTASPIAVLVDSAETNAAYYTSKSPAFYLIPN